VLHTLSFGAAVLGDVEFARLLPAVAGPGGVVLREVGLGDVRRRNLRKTAYVRLTGRRELTICG
jgi:hypothetical protein